MNVSDACMWSGKLTTRICHLLLLKCVCIIYIYTMQCNAMMCCAVLAGDQCVDGSEDWLHTDSVHCGRCLREHPRDQHGVWQSVRCQCLQRLRCVGSFQWCGSVLNRRFNYSIVQPVGIFVCVMHGLYVCDDNIYIWWWCMLWYFCSLSQFWCSLHACVCLCAGLIPCLWAYDGWADVVFLAEEMHSFESHLPIVIVSGIAVVMTCYLSANIA